ncbi:hypothetical protein OGATHE_006575 [Ogataea polymorpha]|uniref:Uncharacterized protein n=1 Tax=Ogataea polymorpha TaxID=460523 RepID=A0A9P8SY57_9ASCO|nr:hypothetical protein OGATHE_006575 [Ogataea polymorpha]
MMKLNTKPISTLAEGRSGDAQDQWKVLDFDSLTSNNSLDLMALSWIWLVNGAQTTMAMKHANMRFCIPIEVCLTFQKENPTSRPARSININLDIT